MRADDQSLIKYTVTLFMPLQNIMKQNYTKNIGIIKFTWH